MKHTYLLIILLTITGCGIEYYENPNESLIVPTDGLLNAAQKQYMDATRGESFNNMALVWMQQWSPNEFTEESGFLYQEDGNLELWNDLYGIAQDLISIIELNEDPITAEQMLPYGSHETQIATARVMLVYIYLTALEIWGDIPYYSYQSSNSNFQANQLQSGIYQPSYATQEEIYSDMLTVLDETAETFSAAEYTMDGDNFYQGDASQWFRFSNSLKLRIANRVKAKLAAAQSYIDEVATMDAATLTETFISSNADNATLTYETSASNASPIYRTFQVERRHYLSPSSTLIELLKGNNFEGNPLSDFTSDPRLDRYASPNINNFFIGLPQTSSNNKALSFTEESDAHPNIINTPNSTLIYMEYAEVCFILSEIKGWNQHWYESGISASMEKWGIQSSGISNFLSIVAPASEKTVMTQKYIALYMQGLETWSEYRRTGHPDILLLPNEPYTYTYLSISDSTMVFKTFVDTFFTEVDIDQQPYRNKYPLNEQNINEANRSMAAERMGGDFQDTKLWWMD